MRDRYQGSEATRHLGHRVRDRRWPVGNILVPQYIYYSDESGSQLRLERIEETSGGISSPSHDTERPHYEWAGETQTILGDGTEERTG